MNTNENQLKINEYYWESHKHKWKSMIIKSHIQGNQWESNAKQSKSMEPKKIKRNHIKFKSKLMKIGKSMKITFERMKINENKLDIMKCNEMQWNLMKCKEM